MSLSVLVRPATESDVRAILEIVNHEIMHSTVHYDYEPRTLPEQQDWFLQKQHKNEPIFVAEIDGTIAGFATYGPFRERAGYFRTIEHSVYVHKDFRGKSVGYQLMIEVIRSAKERDYHTIIAGIDSANKGSVEFHRKFGFEMVGTFREVGYKFDHWLDVIFMQLML